MTLIIIFTFSLFYVIIIPMKLIAQIVIGLPVEGPFDYTIPEQDQENLHIGQRVTVSFGPKEVLGYVVGLTDQSSFSSLKPIKKVLDQEPIISTELMTLARWMSQYYGCSWGEAIETIIPFVVRNRKKLALASCARETSQIKESNVSLLLANDDVKAMKHIIDQAKENLSQKKGVLFLAPDHTTSQCIANDISVRLDIDMARLDCGVSKKFIDDWVALKNGEKICAVGLRSGVFAPIVNLGLVVVLEEHHYGYKEDQMPYYHARDLILERARIEGFNVVFVSSAPTVELWSMIAESGGDVKKLMRDDAASLRLIDLANYKPRKESAFSFPVVTAVSKTLDEDGKILVIFNRRGFSTVIKCSGCGHVLRCERCEVPITYVYPPKKLADVREEKLNKADKPASALWRVNSESTAGLPAGLHEKAKMICTACDAEMEPADECPECKSELNRYGEGIERVESDLAKFFPQAKLATFDRDTKRISRSANIIVATQAVTKILDQLDIDIAVMLDADAELSRHDFRAHQKVFSFLMDLCKSTKDRVFVQTRQPQHPALKYAQSMDLDKFYQEELEARKELGFPPYQHLFEIMVRAKDEALTIEQADLIYEKFLEMPLKEFEAMPPQPSVRAKLRDQYRYIIMGKGLNGVEVMEHIKKVLHEAKKKRGVIVTVNVDP